MYTRMVIGETIRLEQLGELQSLFKDEIQSELAKEDGNIGANFMVEEGGNMMILVTHWRNRESCLKYHSSRAYRQFVAKTQHLLIGNFVVKLFRVD